ncbi:hypothetical protein [Rhizobium sp. LjRoot254]|uniref:hypothetical protein n=1 Tax=Rhizobium sp. LjRoot254 TaxID=3342297 RepID=UPI003ECE61A2
MKKLVPALLLATAVGVNLTLPGFMSPAEAAKCRTAKAPKGLKRGNHMGTTSLGLKYQLSDRPGWIYVRDPKRGGWVVAKCF